MCNKKKIKILNFNMKVEPIPRNILKINKSIVEIERGCDSLEQTQNNQIIKQIKRKRVT